MQIMNRLAILVANLNKFTNRLMRTDILIVRFLARVAEPIIMFMWIVEFACVMLQIPGYHQWEGPLIATTIVGIALFPLWMANWVTRARKQGTTPLRPAIYEVGSPEYNAQVVGAIRTLNEQLASQGKRIPEKAAIQIIHLTDGEDGQ